MALDFWHAIYSIQSAFAPTLESNIGCRETSRGALTLSDNAAIETLKHAPAIPGVIEDILKRWSPRAYSDKPVTPQSLKEVFEAARWAASSYNEQPWRFLVGHRGDETYRKIFDALVEFNQSWAKSAPVLILSAGKKTFTSNGSPNHYQLHDVGAATAYIALQATALGFHAHSMGGFDRAKARKNFDIPEDFEIGAVTALGYLGDPDTLPDQMKQQELATRQRKPLSETVFSEWGTPLKF
jgi:nitroreductase